MLVFNMLNSYVIIYKFDWLGMDLDESQFVYVFCGVIISKNLCIKFCYLKLRQKILRILY